MVTIKREGDFMSILHDKEVGCRGRNGHFWSSGYDIFEKTDVSAVEIRAITSRGSTSSSAIIAVPKEAWMGTALNALLDDLSKRDLLPTCMGIHPLLDALVAERFRVGGSKVDA